MEFNDEIHDRECSICLEEMVDPNGNYVQIKSCRHYFHRKCLIGWILMHQTCPLCRKNMF
jgi:hypothetical protein